ncbi:hypothetical protein BKA70DRAFT_1425996 [Coprinopsis sp. MPI-PUGE-AT-0042]|nr:hypothetical protein BKA70DRAFT_1425996 [Coprinopsis sp. MPI-PUGE-AT-0042]
MSVLVETALAFYDADRKAVLARLRERGEYIAGAILELGGFDYAVDLLKSDDIQYVTKGAALATTLTRYIPSETRPLIKSKSIVPLVTDGRKKLASFLSEPFQPPEGLEESELEEAKAAYDEEIQNGSDWDGHWDKFSRTLGGETIEVSEYEEYQ